jgi:hypothetical protein
MTYKLKNHTVDARQITPLSIDNIAKWCGGKICGVKLPKEDQIIEGYCPDTDSYFEAENGDWIIQYKDGRFTMVIKEVFEELYELA